MVETGNDGYKRVKYGIELDMLALQAIKELKQVNQALKLEKDFEMKLLKEQIQQLQTEINNLKSP